MSLDPTLSPPVADRRAATSVRRWVSLAGLTAAVGLGLLACGPHLADAQSGSGLRGSSGAAALATTAQSGPAPARAPTLEAFLGTGVWRAGTCTTANFQAFRFGPAQSVEVGSGRPGEGERLELLATRQREGFVEIETRVCAPVGCNQTFEVYRVLDPDRLQEWRFEGRLPGREPYVLVADGRATDGSAGRVFTRCGG